jgi:5-oxoprolinase (ATP-hydrolysing) subunit A
MTIDLNSDLGESFGAYTIGADEELFTVITSANIACGFHGGDPRSIERAIVRAGELGVGVGAHPGYPDLVGFGRRVVQSSPEEVRTDTLYQVAAVAGIARAHGVPLQHVKAHGALSLVAAHDAPTAEAVVAGVRQFDPGLPILANPGALQVACEAVGQPFVVEAFADRTYHADGRLTSRKRPDALITDAEAAAARMLHMVRTGTLPTVDGDDLRVRARSICVHSDTPGSVEIMRAVRRALEGDGVTIARFGA